MINFYHRFLPGAAGTLRPLTTALSGNPKTLPWTPEMETAFAAAKDALVAAVPLSRPLPGAVLALAADAGGRRSGVGLRSRRRQGAPRPQGYGPPPDPLPTGTGSPLQPGLRTITQKVGDLDLLGDSSTGTFRPLVPRDLRQQVFEHLHVSAYRHRLTE
jgi:hypothetical protein